MAKGREPYQATRLESLIVTHIGGVCVLTNRDHEVVENTRSRVKINTKLTNLKKLTQIEGYSGE